MRLRNIAQVIEDNEGRTPLDIAQPDVAEILREAGAVNAQE